MLPPPRVERTLEGAAQHSRLDRPSGAAYQSSRSGRLLVGREGDRMDLVTRRLVVLIAGALWCWLAWPASAVAAPSGPPLRIGGTLALTGPLASQGITHKLVGEIYVDQLNRKDGLLGRPVEYVVLDDQSKPEVTRTLYERLVTSDKVDLLIGAFATASNLAAMGVAQRHQKVLITNSMGVPKLGTYEMHFPVQGMPFDPERTFVNTVLDGLASTGTPPKTIAIVASKFPSVHFISVGARDRKSTRLNSS